MYQYRLRQNEYRRILNDIGDKTVSVTGQIRAEYMGGCHWVGGYVENKSKYIPNTYAIRWYIQIPTNSMQIPTKSPVTLTGFIPVCILDRLLLVGICLQVFCMYLVLTNSNLNTYNPGAVQAWKDWPCGVYVLILMCKRLYGIVSNTYGLFLIRTVCIEYLQCKQSSQLHTAHFNAEDTLNPHDKSYICKYIPK